MYICLFYVICAFNYRCSFMPSAHSVKSFLAMKRIWNSIGKATKNSNFQQSAVKQVEKIEEGSVKIPAPKVPTEARRFEAAQKDSRIRVELRKKHEPLVENMNKMHIKSTDPPERWTSTKDLPTRESEWFHRNDPIWEFGFYEPDPAKIPKDKLMFREALEVLRAKQELSDEGTTPAHAKRREIASSALADHAAVGRVKEELLDDMFEYFRPFERKDWQKVVNKHDLAALQDHLQGYSNDMRLTDGAKDHVRELIKDQRAREHYDRLEDEERKKFKEAVLELREAEHERLEKRLEQINQIEDEMKKAVDEAQKKTTEAKEVKKE